MKCPDEYQLERMAKNGGGVLRVLWERHLLRCETCRRKIEEARANLALAEHLRATLRGSAKR